MATLQEFIHGRVRELANDELRLKHELQKISDERDQLRKAAMAAGVHFEPSSQPESLTTPQPRSFTDQMNEIESSIRGATRRTLPERTIKDAVLEVLKDMGHGLSALEILTSINTKFETNYPRTSLSPQLSRLKAEGVLDRRGMIWHLAEPKAEKEETVDDILGTEPSTASEPGGAFE